MTTKKLSNLPPKGTSDWLPEEFNVRNYIFNTWRKVCSGFGYEEYMTPIVEQAEIYRSKSGEDVGGAELLVFKDKGGRELSIRPEMTPSVTRMVSRIYKGAPRPLRYFSIANFWRNESPQRGRNREFWQLNCDVFGSEQLAADLEIAMISIEIMRALKPPIGSYVLYVNSRKLINELFDRLNIPEKNRNEVVRVVDKMSKLNGDEFLRRLSDLGLDEETRCGLKDYLQLDSIEKLGEKFPELREGCGFKELGSFLGSLNDFGYKEEIKFKPDIIRGFDYYDGIVYEMFDTHRDNRRSLFGGGRYNGLGQIFGMKDLPAVGVAPGDETMRLFIESWDLEKGIKSETKKINYFIPLLDDQAAIPVNILASKFRAEGKRVIMGLDKQTIAKALNTANKLEYDKVVLVGSEELAQKKYILKEMETGKEESGSL